MFAVIQTGGKQYMVKEGDMLTVEKLPAEAGGEFVFDTVLLLADDEGAEVKCGTPYLAGAQVKAQVEAQGRAKKIRVVKFKSKVRYHKVYGHRQPFTKVKITSIK